MSEGGSKTEVTTARGDRDQRRRDILAAATDILEESGWAGLNMREVAARAGVSAGATYQWFSGKAEIYAELYDARLRAGIAAIDALPSDMALGDLLLETFRWVARTWTDLGRWQLEFAEISRHGEQLAAVTSLAESHAALLARGLDRIREAAASDQRTVSVDTDTAHLIWGTATGLAMRAAVLQLPDDHLERLQRAAVSCLLAGVDEAA